MRRPKILRIPPAPRFISAYHPLREYFNTTTLQEVRQYWRNQIRRAGRRVHDYVRSLKLPCRTPAIAHLTKRYRVVWRPSRQYVSWLDLSGVLCFPEPGFPEAPVICTLGVCDPELQVNIRLYQWIDRTGRPKIINRGNYNHMHHCVYADSLECHPRFRLHVCLCEFPQWAKRCVDFCLGFTRGEVLPFRSPDAAARSWDWLHVPSFYSPLAERVLGHWNRCLASVTPLDMAGIMQARNMSAKKRESNEKNRRPRGR